MPRKKKDPSAPKAERKPRAPKAAAPAVTDDTDAAAEAPAVEPIVEPAVVGDVPVAFGIAGRRARAAAHEGKSGLPRG